MTLEHRHEARERIVSSAIELLREEGPGALTTRGVAQAAGVQAPAIYRLFGDKDGLLDAVAEHEMARYVEDTASVLATDDPVADLRAAWERHVRFGLANPALFGLLIDPERLARSPVAAAGQDALRTRVHRIAAIGRLRVPEARAVSLIHAAGTGAVLALLTTPLADRDGELADVLFGAVMGTVLSDAPALAADPVTTAAVALRAAAPGLSVLTDAERSLMAEWLDRIATA